MASHHQTGCWLLRQWFRTFLCVLVVLVVGNKQVQVNGFATYLLNNMGCVTDLSTDEVIMNAQVVAASDSDHPSVHLAIVDQEHNKDIVKVEEIVLEDTTKMNRVWLSRNHHPDNDDDALLVELTLVIDDILKDLQYVVETTEGATMVHGQCDNEKRVASRSNQSVTLRIPTTTTKPVQVWAGWATGHEKVRLTPPLEFLFVENSENNNNNNNENKNENKIQKEEGETTPKSSKEDQIMQAVKKEQAEKVKRELVEQLNAYKNKAMGDDAMENNENKDAEDGKKRSNKSGHRKHHHYQKRGLDENPRIVKKTKSDDSRRAKPHRGTYDVTRKDDRRKVHQELYEKRKQRQDAHHKKASEAVLSGAVHAKKLNTGSSIKYDTKEKGISIDMTWFLYGLGFLVFGNVLFLQGCQFLVRKGDAKKRRSL